MTCHGEIREADEAGSRAKNAENYDKRPLFFVFSPPLSRVDLMMSPKRTCGNPTLIQTRCRTSRCDIHQGLRSGRRFSLIFTNRRNGTTGTGQSAYTSNQRSRAPLLITVGNFRRPGVRPDSASRSRTLHRRRFRRGSGGGIPTARSRSVFERPGKNIADRQIPSPPRSP